MTLRSSLARAGVLLCALVAACDRAPLDSAARPPETGAPAAPRALAQLSCTVTPAAGALSCVAATPGTGAASGLVVGGTNGRYVRFQASGHRYSAPDSIFSIDVNVQNLLFQALGTTDGVNPDPAGVRIVFAQEPQAPVKLANEQRGMITKAGQAYFQYAAPLQPNATSEAAEWQFKMPPSLPRFQFSVFVSAAVQYPDGVVTVTPAADTVLAGASVALTHRVIDAYGDSVASQAVVWTTADSAVATVDAGGVVTALAPGTTLVTATAGPRTGSVSITVCPALAVGEVYTATMPGAASLCFGGAAGAAAEYTYMPVNLSTSSSLSLTVTASGIIPVTGPPSPSLMPGGPALRSADEASLGSRDALHQAVRERDRASVARLTSASRVRRGAGGASRVITQGVPAVGDLMNLNVAQGCQGTPDLRTGRVRSVSSRTIIIADTANPAGGFTTAQFDSIALEFDTLSYPVVTGAFGEPTDLDGNNRVVLFYTRGVNELSPPASSIVNWGYFTNRDLFEPSPQGCERSNGGEILYMATPDPTGAVNSNVRSVSLTRGNGSSTITHELQHLVNASRRVYLNGAWNNSFEELWLDEGLSHVAEELVFYRTAAGLTPRANITLANLTQGPLASRRVAAFNTYANNNFTRLRGWLQRPDTTGAFKNTGSPSARGATWAFLRYASDRKGGTENDTWSALVNTQNTGTANLQAVLGVDPNEWLRDFSMAMYADDVVTGAAATYSQPSWNFRNLYAQLGGVANTYGVRQPSNGVGLTLSYSRGGGTMFGRFGVPADGFASVTALSGGVPPTSPFTLIVMRTK